MDYLYLIILCFLLLLCVSDLFVGISNDAVNFLSGAIGSRIATFKTIMMVASCGVLLGATFSGGMMTIARTGVYNPEMYSFHELMLVMFSVVITEVLLLNFFNAFGLPTSTTVSIVFALMGGGVSMATLKILGMDGVSISTLSNYINTDKALVMIFGIISSVPIAFVTGTIVQYLARLLFTFNYQRLYRKFGAIYGGLSMTAICYFLIFKGASGSSLITPTMLEWINTHTQSMMLGIFVGLTVLFQILIMTTKFNVFKVVILGGTFALAFSFAGNDLVNFIGVPLAALDSYSIFQSSGLPAQELMMSGLHEAAPTHTGFLLGAGTVMVLTLWFSKKAMHVVQTTINLSSSDRGDHEQFGSSLPGRLIVRYSIRASEFIQSVIPESVSKVLDSRMTKPKKKRDEVVLPFDAVRASINLVISSILIASATALTLPLSTTYVTFMVAMGTSFADGAWDRESAVYRISGVLTVISGWFFTAAIAFTFCGLLVTLNYYGQAFSILGLVALTVFVFVKVNILSQDKQEDEITLTHVDRFVIRNMLNRSIYSNFGTSLQLFERAFNHFFSDDESGLKRVKLDALDHYNQIVRTRSEYYNMARQDTHIDRDACHFYYRVFTNMKEVGRSEETIIRMMHDHVANRHRIYHGQLQQDLYGLLDSLKRIQSILLDYERLDYWDAEKLARRISQTQEMINQMQNTLLFKISDDDLSLRGSELYLSILQATREMTNRYNIIFLMQQQLNVQCDRELQLKQEEQNQQSDPTPMTPAQKNQNNILRRLFKH